MKWLLLLLGFAALLGFLLCAPLAFAIVPTPACVPGSTPNPPAVVCSAGSCLCCIGDADKNNFVNSTDFAAVITAFGATLPPLGIGDADCNGYVNYADYAAVQAGFGHSCPF